jgi:hypothetical protein
VSNALVQTEWQSRQVPFAQSWQCLVQQPASPDMNPLPSAGVKPDLTSPLLKNICAASTRGCQSAGAAGGGAGGGSGGSGPAHWAQPPQPPW